MTQALRINQIKADKSTEMHVMYMLKPRASDRWQWHDNNQGKYVDFDDESEVLQLEASYQSNQCENYPNRGCFTHCMFQTFMKNKRVQSRNTCFVLEFSVLDEAQGRLDMEYTNQQPFARHCKKAEGEYAVESEQSITLESLDQEYPNVLHRFVEMLATYQNVLFGNAEIKERGMMPELIRMYDTESVKAALTRLVNDFDVLRQRIAEQHDPYNEKLSKLSKFKLNLR